MKQIKKLIIPLLLMLTACIIPTACDGTDGLDRFSTPLAVNSNAITLPATGGITNVAIYADGNWSVDIPEGLDWATLTIDKGSGNGYARLKYNANYSSTVRSFTMHITSGDRFIDVEFTQNAQSEE